jgi:hypothetical protein
VHPSETSRFLRHRGSLWLHLGGCEHLDLQADHRLVTTALLLVAACPPSLMAIATFRASIVPFARVSGIVTVVLPVLVWVVVRRWTKLASPSATFFSLTATIAGVVGLAMGCGRPSDATFNLLSGGSPILAALIGFSMIGLGLFCWRTRLRFLDTHLFGVPASAKGGEPVFSHIVPPIARALGDDDRGLGRAEQRLLAVIRSPWRAFMMVPLAVHLVLALSVAVVALVKAPHGLEPGWRNWLLLGFGCLAFLPLTGNFARIIATWILTRALLRRVASYPAVEALKKLPAALVRPLDAQLGLGGDSVDDLAYPLRVLERMAATDAEVKTRYEACVVKMRAELAYEAGITHSVPRHATAPAEAVADALLALSFEFSNARGTFGEDKRALADEYTASLLAVFVPRYIRHFRLFVPPMIVGAVLSVLLTSLYFVEPARLITSVVFLWVAAMVATVFAVYVDLSRDVVISRIGGTTAGSMDFDWSFVYRVVSWGLVPLGSLVASQSPAFGRVLASFFDVLAKGFR